MKDELRRELRDYAWAYFDRHSEQRLKTFNFYLILAGGVIAGLMTLKDELSRGWPLLGLLSFLTFVFWKLDARNRVLTKHAEEALKIIEDSIPLDDESDGVPHRCKLFKREEYEFPSTLRFPHVPLAFASFSYTTCFNYIFALFGVGGLILAILLAVSSAYSDETQDRKNLKPSLHYPEK